jgi:hypothetical protein
MLDESEKMCVGAKRVYSETKKKHTKNPRQKTKTKAARKTQESESVRGRDRRAVGGAGKVASQSTGGAAVVVRDHQERKGRAAGHRHKSSTQS